MPDYDHCAPYQDLDSLVIPLPTRRLDVGGFVFTDSFDVFLRKLSEEYLAEAWSKLGFYLEKYQTKATDLSWGWAHPGETSLGNYTEKRLFDEPHYFIGWTSQELAEFYQENKYDLLDQDLKKLQPQLRCIATWRSLKWKIASTDFRLGLRLIEYLCIADLTNWSPNIVLAENRQTNDLWLKVAKAYGRGDQIQLNLACHEAKAAYSPAGYRIVMLALASLNGYRIEEPKLQIPDFS